MKVDILQHVPFEGPAAIAEWAEMHGYETRIHKLYDLALVPAADQVDLLILLGGPMSANDSFSWLEEERRLIGDLIKRRRPILGICLGAQQIARALGSSVYQGEHKEVGWLPIDTVSERLEFLPQEMIVFHWHGETFDLPNGAERLFSSEACLNQGFLYGDNVLGLQFHFETTKDSVAGIIDNDRDYIDGSRFVQSEHEMRSFPIPEQNKRVLFRLLDYICGR